MIKKIICVLLSVMLILPLAGCWNYRGLNEMSLAAGVSIDKDPKTGNYKLLVEILDVSSTVKEGIKTRLLETEGKTIFDALRLAKNKTANKLYFGNMSVVVISSDLAKEEDMLSLMDFFLRDAECRETMTFVISKDPTAEVLMRSKGVDSKSITKNIEKIASGDKKSTSTTLDIKMYQMYNILHGQGRSLILPAFETVQSLEENIVSSNGLAVFKDERLAGFLSRDDAQNVMFVLDKVKGGVLTFPANDAKQDNVALEIGKNKTKITYTYKNGTLNFKVSTVTRVFVDESHIALDALDKKEIEELQKKMEQKLQNDISSTINLVQNQFDSDIFGFGNVIYKKDFKLWNKLKGNWDQTFANLNVTVKCEVKIINTAAVVNTKTK